MVRIIVHLKVPLNEFLNNEIVQSKIKEQKNLVVAVKPKLFISRRSQVGNYNKNFKL